MASLGGTVGRIVGECLRYYLMTTPPYGKTTVHALGSTFLTGVTCQDPTGYTRYYLERKPHREQKARIYRRLSASGTTAQSSAFVSDATSVNQPCKIKPAHPPHHILHATSISKPLPPPILAPKTPSVFLHSSC
jgi:hypothetical protein